MKEDVEVLKNRAYLCYYNQKYRRAMRLFNKATRYNNAESHYMMGMCYKNIYQSDCYFTFSVMFLESLAEENDPFAKYYLGVCYEKGLGVEKDIKKAFEMYDEAEKQGLSLKNK